ncbi:N-acetyl-D-Glu racemase DgcA [Sphingomonas jatrophae]|uniref:Dipeptide epimerase n=1 Tax=Sphingomonas jatrophae TaxID=1166337 RepID=A0A1I6L0J1_9SPHN|nr:N-acetyl-D-Glu racemase DgcA [Sphingomonas jatrophae]SFR96974.1 L-alanine-DL-glutamate epimerase [Sphingomonas jatrophae]
MLRTLTAQGDAFPLATPFRISRGVKTVADVVTVEIGDGERVGRGEGVPYPRYGESVADALAEIEAARAAIEAGADRHALLTIMRAGAARNAVDCALWDLEAKSAGTSVPALLGCSTPGRMPTAMTVGLGPVEEMAAAARLLAHVPLLKVKVDGVAPADQIRAVRAAAPGPRIIVDPNESWTLEDVARLQPLLAEQRIDLLEQPLPAGQDDGLDGFRPLVPIAADESVHVAEDVAGLARRYQVVNIKLDKTGGLTGALMLADAAAAAGLQLMVGCMICSSLSIAPALILAQRCAFVDLDGPFWLSNDRAGGVRNDGGLIIPAAAGFWGDTA